MVKFGWNVSDLLGTAAEKSGKGEAFLEPGLRYGDRARHGPARGKLDLISLGLALVLGTAGLPHILIRFYTVPTAREARKSVIWAIWIIGSFYLMTLALGFGAAALVGPEAIIAAGPGRQHGRAAAGPGDRRGLLRQRPAARSCWRSSPRWRSRRSSRWSPG